MMAVYNKRTGSRSKLISINSLSLIQEKKADKYRFNLILANFNSHILI